MHDDWGYPHDLGNLQVGRGHPFELRRPLAKPTARKCAGCGEDVLQHARGAMAGPGVKEDFFLGSFIMFLLVG